MAEPRPGKAAAAPAGAGEAGPRVWALLAGLEREARHAETPAALAYLVVNQTRRLIAYRQAVLARRTGAGRFKVEAVSNVAVPDRNAPYLVWLRAVLRHLDRGEPGIEAARALSRADLPADLARDWSEWWPAKVYWQPLPGADGRAAGGLLLARDAPDWSRAEALLLAQLADTYAHAWRALGGLGRARIGGRAKRMAALGVGVALVAAMALPVRQSAIAPAQVAPRDPIVVAAPLDGVIAEIAVRPNQPVAAGEDLFRFETAELEANRDVADRALALAEADLRRAEQEAFGDARGMAEIALKQAEVILKRAEADYARALMARVTVRAPRDGVAVFADPNAFRGRPVRVGERVMLLADPTRARIAIDLPVADAISLEPGAEVRLFLDTDPLNPLPGAVERAAFEAAETPGGVLAYQVSASFRNGVAPPRIGLRGSAKLYGPTVPLALYLFRRPLAAARQFFGF